MTRVGQRGRRIDRCPAHLDPEQVAGLVERRMPGLGLHDVRLRDATLLARLLPVREDGVEDAAAAAARDEPDRIVAAGAGGVGMHQVEGHRDDLALEAGRAGAHVSLQRVHVPVHLERLRHEGVVLLVAAVERPGGLALLPRAILERRHLTQLAQDLVRRPPDRWHRSQYRVAVGVRERSHSRCPPRMRCGQRLTMSR